jgi:hypothetical protein
MSIGMARQARQAAWAHCAIVTIFLRPTQFRALKKIIVQCKRALPIWRSSPRIYWGRNSGSGPFFCNFVMCWDIVAGRINARDRIVAMQQWAGAPAAGNR